MCRQQRGHRCKEETFGFSGRRRGWDDLREEHWNVYITTCKIDDQCKLDAWSRAPKVGSLGQPRGIGWGGQWEEGSGCRGHMYTCGWFMLMCGQNHHNTVKWTHAKSLQSCLTLSDPTDDGPPGSSLHVILLTRILEWVAVPFSRGSSQPRDRTCLSYASRTGRWVLYHQPHLGSPIL